MTTHHCCIEVKLIVQGSQDVAGVSYTEVPGVSFAEKRHALSKVAVDQLASFVQDHRSFVMRLTIEAELLVLTPSGFFIWTSSDGIAELRWDSLFVRAGLGARRRHDGSRQ